MEAKEALNALNSWDFSYYLSKRIVGAYASPAKLHIGVPPVE